VNIIDEIRGKRVLIWGYGREGKSTENFLNRCCDPEAVEIYEGGREGIREDAFDMIIKSPGIVMKEDHPLYTSQTELFLKQFRDRVVGVTGTKGKSTTSTLLYTVLKECTGKNVVLLGNIGQPCLDYFEEITDDTIIVYEMSCHQLAHTKVSPHIAVFLNFYEEHLDYYGTVENYFKAKSNITKYQEKSDYLFLGEEAPEIQTKANVIPIKRKSRSVYPLKLIGEHNQHNADFVYNIAVTLFGCGEESVLQSMSHFKGLPHRLEYIGSVDGVAYYDDSISTIPEATINAIGGISNVQTVLVGGMDRKINYDILIDFVSANRQLQFIFSYASGKRIYESVSQFAHCHYTEDLESAVRLAKKITPKGSACILSPAAASYGYFKNFEERGDMFQKYVLGESEPR
jgi:UDP-N-acetylmuramoylalanine--D-glutamate ligase